MLRWGIDGSFFRRYNVTMQYVITFLEGVVSFVSPCMLPLLPVYLSYFAPGGEGGRRGFGRAAAFVLGFTLIFCLLGLFAGALGGVLMRYRRAVELVCGLAVILFGLGYLGVLPLPFFKGMAGDKPAAGLLSAFVFGVIYSVSLTPCVGAFLGSALLLASTAGTALRGVTLLLCYSLGLGLPFLLAALLLEQLRGAFDFIKRHYAVIDRLCGAFLILVGAAMALGLLGKLMV